MIANGCCTPLGRPAGPGALATNRRFPSRSRSSASRPGITGGRRPRLQRRAEAEPVTVVVVDLEVAAAVDLITQVAHDRDASRLELGIQRVRVLDPDVRVPGTALRISHAIGTNTTGGCLGYFIDLRQHDDDALPFDHAERRWLVPEPIVMKAQLVAVEVGAADDVVHDEVRRDSPPLAHDWRYFTKTVRWGGCGHSSFIPILVAIERAPSL